MADLNAIFRAGKLVAVPMPYIGNLQSDVGSALMRISVLENQSQHPNYWGYNYVDSAGIDAGNSSNYFVSENVVTNITSSDNTFTTGSDTNYSNRCIVNVYSTSAFSTSGSKVRITFKAASVTDDMDIDAAYISTQAASGDAWDAAADIAQITFSGSGSTTVPAGSSLQSDVIDFDLDNTQVISVAIDLGASGGVSFGTDTDVTLYFKTATDAAADQDRPAGFSTTASRAMGISAIEVFTSPQNMTLVSTTDSVTAASAPDEIAFVCEFQQPDEDVTVGTDLVIEVSRNGGTNYSTVGTYTENTVGIYSVIEGTVDLSGQPSGTDLKARITTPGGTPKEVKIISWIGFFD